MLRALLRKIDFRPADVKSVSSHVLIVNNTTLLSLVQTTFYELGASFRYSTFP